MTGSDGADLLPSLSYIAPDDGNPYDRTVAEVDSGPARSRPGETISVAMDFVSRLPRVSVRTGYKGDFFIVVQWFPKIGVFEENGWNCHQFHASSEFFADFGNYDVSIDVPARYKGKVGATGRRVEERETSVGRVLYRFQQEGVHDFAWTADPSLSRPGGHVPRGGTRRRPAHAAPAARARGAGGAHFRAAKAALSGYGRVLGAYPYGTLTDRGSALGRPRRGRHGVPDAHHGGDLLERPAERAPPRGRHRPRDRATSSSTACSPPTSSRRRGSTRASTPT